MELLGPWSEIHDNIWTYLVEVPHWGYGPLEADRSRQIVLAEVREYGRIAEAIPGLCKILSGHVWRPVFFQHMLYCLLCLSLIRTFVTGYHRVD